jgi:hypothetical protein
MQEDMAKNVQVHSTKVKEKRKKNTLHNFRKARKLHHSAIMISKKYHRNWFDNT